MINKEYKDYLELLYKSLDFELDASETRDLTEGFQLFPDLLNEREDLIQLRDNLRHLDPPALPADFGKNILQKIADHSPFVFTLNQFWVPAIAASIILLIGIFFLQQHIPADQVNLETLVGIEEISPEDALTYLDIYQPQ